MSLSSFFASYPGMFIVQTCCHSLVALLLAEMAIRVWAIGNPLARQRFSLLVITLPVLSFPLYQALFPSRGSVSFRINALFDSNRWLTIDLWGAVPLATLLLAVLAVTTAVFVFQELIPIVKHAGGSAPPSLSPNGADDQLLQRVRTALPGPLPAVHVVESDEMFLYSNTKGETAVVISSGLVHDLTEDQLKAALVHELAHIDRNKRPVLMVVFFLRVLMFFNPVVLLEFRRIVQLEEKICDDAAVAVTGKPEALAGVLKKFYHMPGGETGKEGNKVDSGEKLIQYSHNLQIESRINRLGDDRAGREDGSWYPWVLTLLAVVVLNFFVV
ncbi:MAG TPA: M56 family metallopeptidase [Dissulfurispiraceae bacterium]|nr:M56 family metallopeptidase [Dissulfurispiraceae bacterium]